MIWCRGVEYSVKRWERLCLFIVFIVGSERDEQGDVVSGHDRTDPTRWGWRSCAVFCDSERCAGDSFVR